jgi:hypothetical protein
MSRRLSHVLLLVIAAFWAFLPVLAGLIGAETAARTAPPVADVQVLPEPATLVLMGTGVILVVVIRRRK